MADYSDTFGSYHFDFIKSHLNPDEQIDFIKKLGETLTYVDFGNGEKCWLEAYTLFDEDSLSTSDDTTDVLFSGSGRWAYHNNLEWFKTEEDIVNHLKTAGSLTIHIEYTDILQDTYCQGQAVVTVFQAGEQTRIQVSIRDEDWQDFYPKRYLELDVGDYYDCINHFNLEEYSENISDEEIGEVMKMDYDTFCEWRDSKC